MNYLTFNIQYFIKTKMYTQFIQFSILMLLFIREMTHLKKYLIDLTNTF